VPIRAILVTLLVLLAGCGGTLGSTPAPPTVTPAPVPVTTEVPQRDTNPDYPPGMGRHGIVNPSRLVEAHAEILGRESFTVHVNSTRRQANGTIRSRYSWVMEFGADKGRFYYVLRQIDRNATTLQNRRIERWADGHHVVERTIVDGRQTSRIIRESNPSRSFPENATNRLDLYRLLTSVDTEVEEAFKRDGRTEYHLIGGPQEVPPLEDVTFTAVVSDRGVIRSFRVAYTVGRDETRVVVSARYDRLGETTVSRPHWVAEID